MTRSTRNYNHNVDIKSTQVAGAFQSFAKFALGAGIVTIGGIVVLAAIFTNVDNNREKEALSRTKPLVLNSALVDYNRNPVRYDANWQGEYVTYSGRIDKLSSYEFSFSPVNTTRGSSTVVKCDFDHSEREKIAQMNNGDYVSVLGKLNLRKISYGRSQFEAELEDCKIR